MAAPKYLLDGSAAYHFRPQFISLFDNKGQMQGYDVSTAIDAIVYPPAAVENLEKIDLDDRTHLVRKKYADDTWSLNIEWDGLNERPFYSPEEHRPRSIRCETRKKPDGGYVSEISITDLPTGIQGFGSDILEKYNGLQKRTDLTLAEKEAALQQTVLDKCANIQSSGKKLYDIHEDYTEKNANRFRGIFGKSDEHENNSNTYHALIGQPGSGRAAAITPSIIFEHNEPIEWPKEMPSGKFIQDVYDAVADSQVISWMAPNNIKAELLEVTQPKEFSFKNWPAVEKQLKQTGKAKVQAASVAPQSIQPLAPEQSAEATTPISSSSLPAGLKDAIQKAVDWHQTRMQQVLLDEELKLAVNSKTTKQVNMAEAPWHKACYVLHNYAKQGTNSPHLSITDSRSGLWYFGREGDVNPELGIDLGKKYEAHKDFPVMEMEAAMRMGFPRGFEEKFEAMRQDYQKYQWPPRMQSLIDAGLFDCSYDQIKQTVYDLAPSQKMQPWVYDALKNDTEKNYLKPMLREQEVEKTAGAAHHTSALPPENLTPATSAPHSADPEPATDAESPPEASSEKAGYGNTLKAAGGIALLAGGAYLATQDKKEEAPSASPQNPSETQQNESPKKKGLSFASVSMMVVGAVLTGWAAYTWYQRANGPQKQGGRSAG